MTFRRRRSLPRVPWLAIIGRAMFQGTAGYSAGGRISVGKGTLVPSWMDRLLGGVLGCVCCPVSDADGAVGAVLSHLVFGRRHGPLLLCSVAALPCLLPGLPCLPPRLPQLPAIPLSPSTIPGPAPPLQPSKSRLPSLPAPLLRPLTTPPRLLITLVPSIISAVVPGPPAAAATPVTPVGGQRPGAPPAQRPPAAAHGGATGPELTPQRRGGRLLAAAGEHLALGEGRKSIE